MLSKTHVAELPVNAHGQQNSVLSKLGIAFFLVDLKYLSAMTTGNSSYHSISPVGILQQLPQKG